MANENDEKREQDFNATDGSKKKKYIWLIIGICIVAVVIVVIVIAKNTSSPDQDKDNGTRVVDATGIPTEEPKTTNSVVTDTPDTSGISNSEKTPDSSNATKDEEMSDSSNALDDEATTSSSGVPTGEGVTESSEDGAGSDTEKDENNTSDIDKPEDDSMSGTDVSKENDDDDWVYPDEPGDPSVLPEAGTYILITETSMGAALSIPKDTALQLKDDALEYYKKAGTYKGLVMQEDGTGVFYFNKDYSNVLIEDGYFYIPEYGRVCATFGNIFTAGLKDGSKYWRVFYRLSPEEAATLPEPTQEANPCTDISKIRIDSGDQLIALDNIFDPVISKNGNISDFFDEAYNAVLEASEKEAQEKLEGEEKRKAIDEASKGLSVDACMTFREKQVSVARVMELNGGSVPIDIDNGKVTFIGGTCTDKLIENKDDAYSVLESIIDLLGGDEYTEYEYLSTMKDSRGYSYYTFLQMHDLKTVPGGAAKIIVDGNNNMKAVTSTLIGGVLYDGPSEIKAIDADSLKDIVYKQKICPKEELVFYEEFTGKILLPLVLDPDLDDEVDFEKEPEKVQLHFVWVIYTNNPDSGSSDIERYPYLAHYITQEGEYLHNLPVAECGDEASSKAYPASYFFCDMESAEWTGTVEYSDGHEETITVPVMRDPESGIYYLGDKKRRIALADCYEFQFNGFNVDMVSSETNDDWDDYFLITYKNTISVWDYYAERGWMGTDGIGTPILLLMDYCYKDHDPMDNAFYVGNAHGWELFGYSSINDLGMALDVVAHEFTHGFSSNSMTFNFYRNDEGAINEALSDIMGNIIESDIEPGDTDPNWLLGEDVDEIIRDMSDPRKYGQPEYVWDRNYIQSVKKYTEVNDRGGVHYNSSLLGRIAYRLYKESSMPLEDAFEYWSYCIYSIVPNTDFKQLSLLLPWLMDEAGMGQYTEDLKRYIQEVRIMDKNIPEELEEGTTMIVLELPEDDKYMDDSWGLYIIDRGKEYSPQYVFPEKEDDSEEKDSEEEDSKAEDSEKEDSEEDDSQNQDEKHETIKVIPANTSIGCAGEDQRTIKIVVSNSLPKYMDLLHYDTDTHSVDCSYMYKNEKWIKYDINDKNPKVSSQSITIPDGYYVLSTDGLE